VTIFVLSLLDQRFFLGCLGFLTNKKMKKIQKQRTDTLGRKRRHIRASAALGKRELERERERAFQNETLCCFALSFFLSFFLWNDISLSLLLRARALRRREKYGDGKILFVYGHLDGDHSSGVSFDRRGLPAERFEVRQEMGRGAAVWVTFTTTLSW